MSYDPTAHDITHGLDRGALGDLTDEQRETVLTLLARASERSYRRGFQQGVVMAETGPESIRSDLHGWRYGVSADLSPWADCPRVEPSLSRLFTENRNLVRLGLYDPGYGGGAGLKVDETYHARREGIR